MLPILEKKDEIISLLKKEQVVIISGETGSGKTTQLPQICMELGLAQYGKIAITQPRRIAATSIAKRIANETETPLGALVGYKIRFSQNLSQNTKILCMTDGILLSELVNNPKLLGYSVIIIDEAHLLSHEMLEEIRFLLNLEMDSKSSCSLILVGQTELRSKLKLQIHQAIDGRVNMRFHLEAEVHRNG
jgi:ATP-dependent helicase HrpA